MPHGRPDDLAAHGAWYFWLSAWIFWRACVPHAKLDDFAFMGHGDSHFRFYTMMACIVGLGAAILLAGLSNLGTYVIK